MIDAILQRLQEIIGGKVTTSTEPSSEIHFVDLGLPSGTLWADRDVAVRPLDESSLPSYEQAQELIECCDFCIRTTPDGEKSISVLGPSGKFIYFPMEDYEGTPGPSGCCWCRGGGTEEFGYFLLLSKASITIGAGHKSLKFPYRMVL